MSRKSASRRSSMNTGPPKSTSLHYWVGHHSQPVRSYLIEKRRGHCRWKISLQFRITFLCEPYGSSLCSRPSHPANNTRTGGTYSLVAQRTRRIVIKGTIPYDGCTNGEGRGQSY